MNTSNTILCTLIICILLCYHSMAQTYPTVSVQASAAREGVSIQVSLTMQGIAPCYITYQTSDGTATAGLDYVATSGSIVYDFYQFQSTQVVSLLTLVDTLPEGNETLSLTFTSTKGCFMQANTIQLSILDNPPPVVSVNSVTLNENQDWYLLLEASLSTTYDAPVFFSVTPSDGTAKLGSDYIFDDTNSYVSWGQMQFVILPGSLTAQLRPIRILADGIYENDEVFFLNISNVINGIAGSNGTVTIKNQDPPPTLIMASTASVSEAAGQYSFTVNLTSASSVPANVSYSVTGGTATPIFDFIPANGTLTFAPGETTKTVSISIVQDPYIEDTETFLFSLFNANDATINVATQVISIIDDEPMASCWISTNTSSVPEGVGNVTFAISISSVTARNITVLFSQMNGTADTSDFVSVTTNLTIPAGSTSVQISLPIVQDSIIEPDENFTALISSPIGCVITTNSVSITIRDDDTPVATSRAPGVARPSSSPSRSPGAKSMMDISDLDSTSSASIWWPRVTVIAALLFVFCS